MEKDGLTIFLDSHKHAGSDAGPFSPDGRLSSIIDEESAVGGSNASGEAAAAVLSGGIIPAPQPSLVVTVENVQLLTAIYNRIETALMARLGISKSNSFVPESTTSSASTGVNRPSQRASASSSRNPSSRDFRKRLEAWVLQDYLPNLYRLPELTAQELNECFHDLVVRIEVILFLWV